jgi:hypothetical protein
MSALIFKAKQKSREKVIKWAKNYIIRWNNVIFALKYADKILLVVI